MIKRNAYILLILFSATIFSAFRSDVDPETNVLRTIINKLQNHYQWYPQQKAYLHTDKSRYDVSDRIWFKGYVMNASNHLPDRMSSNLYVELINPTGYVVQTRLLPLEQGFAEGDFSLQDTVPEGRYKLRAYTNWMRNAGSGFMFSKDIYVHNPGFKVYATKDEVRDIQKSRRKTSRLDNRYDISFHPEGGSMLLGVENVIAYKAINGLGMGVDFKGNLIDRKGNAILSFESDHLGMGTFNFTPQADEKYKLEAVFADGSDKKYDLPDGIEMGVNLQINPLANDSIHVRLLSNIESDNYPPNTVYHLLAHTRGNPRFSAEMDLKNDRNISVPKDLFPNGIAHFTLFNSSSNPVSERLVFIYDDPGINIAIDNKSSAGKREKINTGIEITDRSGDPVQGSFSFAVVKNSRLTETKSIISEMLLTSDLKGHIERPEFYFDNYNAQKAALLDKLMLTQGWRRFDWSTVKVNKRLPTEYQVEEGIEISGKITREFFGLPLSDIRVTLTILNEFNDVYTTRSGPKGRFSFKNLNYADTVSVKLEAVRKNGKKNLVIVLDTKDPDHLEDMHYLTEQYLRKPGEEGRWVTEKTPEEIERENDPFYEENNRYHRIHQEPNDVIKVDERMNNYSSVAQIIQGRVPGVMVNGNNITIRGINTFYGSTDPLFLVDGIPVDKGFALGMNPNDIDRIEILKGPDAAIYGSRGANGVIAIYTKRGKFMLKGVLDFQMLGYYDAKEYYSPKYEVEGRDEQFNDERTTLYWEPSIETGADGKANLDFYTSDLEGSYSIIIEGTDKAGNFGTGKAGFEVR